MMNVTWRRGRLGPWIAVVSVMLIDVCVSPLTTGPLTRAAGQHRAVSSGASTALDGIHKIQHIVIIMQENRSFDSYFGTYPGADGIPMANGTPSVCVPDPRRGCIAPFHTTADVNYGGSHTSPDATTDIDGGRMDGFITDTVQACTAAPIFGQFNPSCGNGGPFDVMAYHDGHDIPNYWAYAQNFVLQDHMFAPTLDYSAPSHLYLVSGWSAKCTVPNAPASCDSTGVGADVLTNYVASYPQVRPQYAWTDLTYLLHQHRDQSGNPAPVSWKYYIADGTQPDCADGTPVCMPLPQTASTPEFWNPLPFFSTVQHDGDVGNIQNLTQFYQDAMTGTLPAVSWIVPSNPTSEHPPSAVSRGQAYVTTLVNTLMSSPNWNSTAIFLSWDDWGGFYDHEVPPMVDGNGYGLRVPGLVISPYAKQGYIDHQILSFDAYIKFIEDDFLNGQRIDPATDGRPDPRPDVRETTPQLGDLVNDFDFTQPPRPPLVLQPFPSAATVNRAAGAATSEPPTTTLMTAISERAAGLSRRLTSVPLTGTATMTGEARSVMASAAGTNRQSPIPLLPTGVITTYVGGAQGEGVSTAYDVAPQGVVLDGPGHLLIADAQRQVVWLANLTPVTTTLFGQRIGAGQITRVAGSDARGFSGDGGTATSSELNAPSGLAVDGAGNLLIADTGNNRIRKVLASSGLITTVAGGGACSSGGCGDGGAATQAALDAPMGLAIDAAGHLFIADSGNNRVREVLASSGLITTVAGSGLAGFSGDGSRATQAHLSSPGDVSLDGSGNLFIADSLNNRIREVLASSGVITTVAGSGQPGRGGYGGDGSLATQAQLSVPAGVVVDGSGNLFIADSLNNRIREVLASTGVITTVAGTGTRGFSGDGGPATQAQLTTPVDVALDGAGDIFIADSGNYGIREETGSGTITTVAGNHTYVSGDGERASPAELSFPMGITVDGAGNLFIADSLNNRIREVLARSGVITTVAGSGPVGFSGDGGPAAQAELSNPFGLTRDGAGDLFIADTGNFRIREVTSSGVITTVAGGGFGCPQQTNQYGDGCPAGQAELYFPSGVAMDGAGNLFIADTGTNRIREVIANSGIITTVVGSGALGSGSFSGDGGPAGQAGLYAPTGVTVDNSGNLFIADSLNDRIREVVARSGVITTVAGTGTPGFGGDGSPAIQAPLNLPSDIATDGAGNLFIADSLNNRIREVIANSGIITTVVGSGLPGFGGDGGPAAQAQLNIPSGVTMDSTGHLFVADTANNRVRMAGMPAPLALPPTPTTTPTNTPTSTPTSTATSTPTSTATNTPTSTATNTSTSTPTNVPPAPAPTNTAVPPPPPPTSAPPATATSGTTPSSPPTPTVPPPLTATLHKGTPSYSLNLAQGSVAANGTLRLTVHGLPAHASVSLQLRLLAGSSRHPTTLLSLTRTAHADAQGTFSLSLPLHLSLTARQAVRLQVIPRGQPALEAALTLLPPPCRLPTALATLDGHPLALALDAPAHLVLVATSSGTLDLLDACSGALRAHLAVGGTPGGLAADPGSSHAFVLVPPTVRVLDLHTRHWRATVSLPATARPNALLVDSHAHTLLVLDPGDATLWAVDTRSGRVLHHVGALPGGRTQRAVALDAGRGRAYVASTGSHSVSVIDTAHWRLLHTTAVGQWPQAVAASSSTGRVFVANRDSHSVSVLDGASGRLLRTVHLSGAPRTLAIDERTRVVYVATRGRGAHGKATLVKLDAATGGPVRTPRAVPHGPSVVVDPATGTTFYLDPSSSTIVAGST